MKWLFFNCFILVLVLSAYSQSEGTSVSILNEDRAISSSEVLVVDTDSLIIGPFAELYIEGVLEIRSAFILIDPMARIQGPGLIKIVSPSLLTAGKFNGYTATLIDANGNLNFDVAMEIWNKANVVLTNLSHSFLKGSNYQSSDFYTNAIVRLMEDGVCIELGGNKMALGYDAFIENISENRLVLSGGEMNSIFAKKIYANSKFEFPIGMIEGDYCSVTVQPEKDAQFFVSLIDESAKDKDISFTKKRGGIGRIWGVHADHNVRTSYIFKHNKSDFESDLMSSQLEIYQYSDLKEWKLLTTSYLSDEEHSTKNLSSMYSKVAKNYFSKYINIGIKPSSQDDYVKLQAGQAIVIPVLANDKAGDGIILKEKTEVIEKPENGLVEILVTGDIRYQPFSGFNGTDFFVYEIIDEFGLTSQSTVFISVGAEVFYLQSNVLTPNGDGHNDHLVFVGREKLLALELIVLNRWGERLYESKNYNNTWGGENLSGGTYYYVAKAKKLDGEVIQQKGWLYLSK